MWDYYEERGCCLTCEYPEEMRGYRSPWGDKECICYECKCRKCDWYERDTRESGHCTHPSLYPPEGRVVIKVDEGRDLVEVKILPYLEPVEFQAVVDILKSSYFQYNPSEKTWTRRVWAKQSIQSVRNEIEELGVTVHVEDEV